jgi:hypothetical protein
MAATAIASVQLSRTPTADPSPTFCDATNGNITPNSGATIFRLQNTDSSSHTVTFTTIPTEDGLALADLVITLGASAKEWLSEFDTRTFGSQLTYQANSALVEVTAFEP